MRWCYTLDDGIDPAERDATCLCYTKPDLEAMDDTFDHGVDVKKNRDSVGRAYSTAPSLRVEAHTISRI